ncbi:hypothetical protein S1361_38300 [Streptomyces cyanogenus]|uniref:Uncharacterized protein n=1 Tax=Streptomyces cyanogenus TaxID=80860 RepID=A0ABX7U2G3_STRCY|nr:hypothetical protein S1361_00200 [Streptomyces cyanogenus]QTE03251.1 hypothetical protein S1361_38300 [Streptomyces cyanogenus]
MVVHSQTLRASASDRLFRSVADILTLRSALIRRGLHLRVESGLLSGIDSPLTTPAPR